MSTLSTQPSELITRFLTHPPSSSTTTPPLPSQPIDETQQGPVLAEGQTDGQKLRTDENVFNYYFLFFALFGALVAGSLWWAHRRRKKQKEQTRLSGQHALAQDLEGLINTRRFMHGENSHSQTGALIQREEGLDEHGEAPPPYKPKSEDTVAAGTTQSMDDCVTIPLRTLLRDGVERAQPPLYEETTGIGSALPATPSRR
ncbi:hypothetical protein P153DRAFT_356249 [Dothidotthia symphoricarpi CBS 119687]|uniref:Uncharacterized protein n=1 Tax=Dothidotthia symphoricarpi CBS 119687 TaxID=1392245 RepID=A0A6A6AFC6_9PLEO|nr:uncharacterized protein P153DRAFT_356249 [Dothidotthia symphoricarpi CBS 119687]KAF2130490.1 hypothetical protein P153DRAFT_356249 [Dothidotthia symphoricarpi CBS 119687]